MLSYANEFCSFIFGDMTVAITELKEMYFIYLLFCKDWFRNVSHCASSLVLVHPLWLVFGDFVVIMHLLVHCLWLLGPFTSLCVRSASSFEPFCDLLHSYVMSLCGPLDFLVMWYPFLLMLHFFVVMLLLLKESLYFKLYFSSPIVLDNINSK